MSALHCIIQCFRNVKRDRTTNQAVISIEYLENRD